MSKPFISVAGAVETIVSGARLLAIANGLDPQVMENIVRKSANVAREAMFQRAKAAHSNDRD